MSRGGGRRSSVSVIQVAVLQDSHPGLFVLMLVGDDREKVTATTLLPSLRAWLHSSRSLRSTTGI